MVDDLVIISRAKLLEIIDDIPDPDSGYWLCGRSVGRAIEEIDEHRMRDRTIGQKTPAMTLTVTEEMIEVAGAVLAEQDLFADPCRGFCEAWAEKMLRAVEERFGKSSDQSEGAASLSGAP